MGKYPQCKAGSRWRSGGEANPYADEPGIAYAYDDQVQNHKQVRMGDVLFLRNTDRLEGIGRISRIVEDVADKTFRRCPICGSSKMHERLRPPGYKCVNGHVFDRPAEITCCVKAFRAYFDGDYITVRRRITSDELRPFQLQNSTQMAIMPIDLIGLSQHILSFAGGRQLACSVDQRSARSRSHQRDWISERGR